MIAFRALQEARLRGRTLSGGWPRLERTIERQAMLPDTLRRWIDRSSESSRIVPESHVGELIRYAGVEPAWRDRLLRNVKGMRSGTLTLFDQPVTFPDGALPWHTDWHVGYDFPQQFFKSYRFFGVQKAVPYDVKFPWELSRFGFAVPLALGAVVFENDAYRDLLIEWISDWRRSNPFAFSVNWHPMECAMRGINVALAAELLIASGRLDTAAAREILPFIASQGEFLARTLERTDINNNHFFANSAGLAIIGATLARSGYPAAPRWMRFGLRWVARETMHEFYPDGVNFEGSIAYHRFVAELGLLVSIVASRFDASLPVETTERLRAAWKYAVAYSRPDGFAPNIGDNDGAQALCFDSQHSRDHTTFIALGAAYFGESPLPTSPASSGSVPVLLGLSTRPVDLASPTAPATWQHFPDGGVVVARTIRGDYLWADYGPVGLAGRGGHGHNDIFSFELSLRGRPVVVDPGCPTYSGNPKLYREFCGSRMHNGLTVDDIEVAPLLGPWRIGNDAQPFNVVAFAKSEALVIRGEHRGYRRLADAVNHLRTIQFDLKSGSLLVEDKLEANAQHRVDRWLHLAPGVQARMCDHESLVLVDDRGVIGTLQWDDTSHTTIKPGQVSDAFSHVTDAVTIQFTTRCAGAAQLWFTIQPTSRSTDAEMPNPDGVGKARKQPLGT
ncbi:MAG: Heparin-sulfate lyase [Gemmatimonadales bacterium]|nr:Heparin-sulfate lyase [Gemmatimonadales bacterium]